MQLEKITAYLNTTLDIPKFEDFPAAHNGLQIENDGHVKKIAASVDACEATIRGAIECGADILLVHHGLFWGGNAPVTGPMYRKLALAIKNNLAVYSVHLPLDAHPIFGNNILLAKALGFSKKLTPAFPEFGRTIGLLIETDITRDKLIARFEKFVGDKITIVPKGPQHIKRIGMICGGAGSHVADAARLGADTYISGEGSHFDYHAAEEHGINYLLGGHYMTETLGIRALAEQTSRRFKLPWEFIPHPTGM